MNKTILIFYLTLLSIFLFTASATASKLTFVSDQFPPYYYEANSETKGLQYELATHVFKKMRKPFEIQFMPWKRALMVAESFKADGIFGLRKTDQRKRWLIYPDEPLMVVKTVIFSRKDDNFEYTGINSLAGKKVGIIKGYTYGKSFDKSNLFKKEEVSSLNLNFLKLVAGRIDFVAAYKAVGVHTMGQMNLTDKISFSSESVNIVPIFIGFTKKPGNVKIAREFSRHLKEFKHSPECVELINRLKITKDMISPCYAPLIPAQK